jgi:hypothetical protein
MFLIDSPELVGMQHEVTALNAEAASHRRIEESDEEEVITTVNVEQVS